VIQCVIIECFAVAAYRCYLPVALGLLRTLAPDLEAIGIDPADQVGEFTLGFRHSLERIGLEPRQSLGLLSRMVSQAPLPTPLPLPVP
jgi:hypothetical protein